MKVLAKNKKLYLNYHVEETFQAGMSLLGSEVKSIKAGTVSFEGSYISTNDDGLFIKNLNIAVYKFASEGFTHKPLRDRQLLLNKEEIRRIKQDLKKNNNSTLAPISLLANKRGFVKLEFALVTGKNKADKRQDMIEKEARKEITEIRQYKRKTSH